MEYACIPRVLVLGAVLAMAAPAVPVRAQSTTFTYQGHLDDDGAPAAGMYDFVFGLFDAGSGGVQIGPIQCVDDVEVTEGVFTVQIDFGPQFATAAERHLEISVRQDTGLSCGDGTGFVVMNPRQELTAAPMASHANAAFSLDAADGSPAGAVYVDNDGDVGIATTAPTTRLDVRGGAISVENLGDQADLLWLASERSWVFRQEGSGAASGLKLVSVGGGGNKNFAIQTDGFVGVGTTAPIAKLDVRGDIRLGSSGQYYAVRSPARDRSLRGQINANGTIDATRSSGGFTVTHSSTGVYSVNFTEAFASPPTVVVSGQALCCRARVTITNTGSAFVHVLDYDTDVLTDAPFHFIAMGP